MRIAVVNSACSVIGGTEAYIASVLPALAANGHGVSFLHETVPAGGRSICDGLDIPTWQCDAGRPQEALARLAAWQPDVVYAHGLGLPTLDHALLTRFPVAMFAHNYYGTCGTGSKTLSFPVSQPCSRTFGPMCLALHYPRRCGGLNPATTLRIYRQQTARRENLALCKAVLVASRHMEAEFRNHGVPAARLHWTPLPLTAAAPDDLPPRARPQRGRLVMVSRLTKEKGGEHLVRALPLAAAKLGRPLSLTIAGTGPERGRLEALARQLALDVKFAGWVEVTARTALMREADLLVMPSLWPEPFGLVGLEAGCVGLPAVAYASGGILEWLEPGASGEVAGGDRPTVEGLADAIVRALADSHHYHELRRRAWEKTAHFSMSRHLARLESIFEQVTAS